MGIKKNIYLNEEAAAILEEAIVRLDRPPSWIIQMALKIAKPKFEAVPRIPVPRS